MGASADRAESLGGAFHHGVAMFVSIGLQRTIDGLNANPRANVIPCALLDVGKTCVAFPSEPSYGFITAHRVDRLPGGFELVIEFLGSFRDVGEAGPGLSNLVLRVIIACIRESSFRRVQRFRLHCFDQASLAFGQVLAKGFAS